MQYPVPQFTDVEDKIFGPLTLKQFGIVGSAGVLTFLAYSSTKDLIITSLVGLAVCVPAIGLAFGKLNGRPLYNSIFALLGYFFRPRFMLFHKESKDAIVIPTKVEAEKVVEKTNSENPSVRIKSLFYSLGQQEAAEQKLVKESDIK